MASMTEALGMALSGNAAIPAVDSRRRVMAHLTGNRIVQMVKDDLKPSDVMTPHAFENAIRGSTNAVIHLLAIAGRVGVDRTLDDWDRCGRDVPTIVNLMPSGEYLMEEFFYAGGLPVVIIDETCVMVLKNFGPRGYPGMAEVGNMGLPPKVLRRGITDMVRISDARMSGTAYGTVVLHASPEAARGGPLAVVRTGDMIALDVPNRRLHLDISEAKLSARMEAWTPSLPVPESGYARLYHDRVEGADTGADFDFLRGCRGAAVARESH